MNREGGWGEVGELGCERKQLKVTTAINVKEKGEKRKKIRKL